MGVRNYSDIGTNAQLIVKRLLANQQLLKLLFYTDRDPLNQPDIETDIIEKEIFGKLIKIVPRTNSEDLSHSYIAIQFETFSPNAINNEFKDTTINIEVYTPLDNWIIKNENLRPFLLMGEIEKSLKNKQIEGLGKMTSLGGRLNYITDEITDYIISFRIISYD